jgi:hypothetical protein
LPSHTLPKPNIVGSAYVSSSAKPVTTLFCSKTLATESTSSFTLSGNTSHPSATSRLQPEVFRVKVFRAAKHILCSLQTLIKQLLVSTTESLKFRTLRGQKRFFLRRQPRASGQKPSDLSCSTKG